MSASQLSWRAAGSPDHHYQSERVEDNPWCATCGGSHLSCGPGDAVALTEIETPTTANHADLFRFQSRHVCHACAWLYGAGKGRPGNFYAIDGLYEQTVISLDSVVWDKRPWRAVLEDLLKLRPGAVVTGVMTTDVKPRLWPRARLSTLPVMGLYVHAPDYDHSEWVEFDLPSCVILLQLLTTTLSLGYSKHSVYRGIVTDQKRFARDPVRTMQLYEAIEAHREQPHFLPALIAAGATKEERASAKRQLTTGADEPAPAARHSAAEAQHRLL